MNDAYYEGAVEWVNGGQQNPEHLHCLREQRDYCLLGHLIVEFFFNENLNLEDDDVEAAPDLDCVQHEGEGEGAEGRIFRVGIMGEAVVTCPASMSRSPSRS